MLSLSFLVSFLVFSIFFFTKKKHYRVCPDQDDVLCVDGREMPTDLGAEVMHWLAAAVFDEELTVKYVSCAFLWAIRVFIFSYASSSSWIAFF